MSMPPKDKKPDKKDDKKPGGWNLDAIEWIVVLLIFLAIISTIIPAIIRTLTSSSFSFYGLNLFGIVDFVREHALFFKILGFVVAGVAAVGTFIFNQKANAIWRAEKERLNPQNIPAYSGESVSAPDPVKIKWQKILERSESENSSDWRLAIIEADIMLDDLLRQLQLPGDTMGDKLKAVEKSDFNTIESAWEAHKIRNMIAHDGSDFLVSQREIRRVISLYEAVFKEFHLI